jgi:hypothetical protein
VKRATLQFSIMVEMLDFEKTTSKYGLIKAYSRLTVKRYFEEADIKIAKGGFNAIVIEEEPQ